MAEDYYGYDEDEEESKGGDHLFLWTIFILLMIGLAFASWLGSFYVFGHPEKAQPYAILKKLHKIEPPHRFEITAAPQGEYLSPQKLWDRFSRLKPLELQQTNAELLRNYIKNYHETKAKVIYVTGRFEIVDSFELQQTDMFQSGVVALASAVDSPQVLIEHVYPSAPENIPKLRTLLKTGLDMKLEKTYDLAAVIHVERTFEGRLQFTVVPLLYGTYALRQGVGTFSLQPPDDLNIAAGVPVVRGKMLQDALHTYADYRKKRPVAADDDDATEKKEPELVRLDAYKPGTKVPETGALPEPTVATPIPATTPQPPKIAGRPASTPQLAMNTTPRMRASTPGPAPTPPPVVASTSPTGVPLKPFIASRPEMPAGGSGNWRTYAPGQQPPGKTISASEASALAERGDIGERLYLRGNFVVTASGENRAVLRLQGATGDPKQPGSGAARIIVEYPNSALPPAEGSSVARDDQRGFEVRDVRRGADGQINIYVREVLQP